nr:hypothetical protein [Streptacidiphilus rugosus]
MTLAQLPTTQEAAAWIGQNGQTLLCMIVGSDRVSAITDGVFDNPVTIQEVLHCRLKRFPSDITYLDDSLNRIGSNGDSIL